MLSRATDYVVLDPQFIRGHFMPAYNANIQSLVIQLLIYMAAPNDAEHLGGSLRPNQYRNASGTGEEKKQGY